MISGDPNFRQKHPLFTLSLLSHETRTLASCSGNWQSRLTPAPWRVGAQWSVDTRWRRSQVSIVDRHPSWLTHRSGPIQRADPLKIQNLREECTSVFLQILWKRQRVVAERSLLKKKDSFSCRHCFPVFSRAAPEWLNHFRSSGRHFDSYAHIMDCTERQTRERARTAGVSWSSGASGLSHRLGIKRCCGDKERRIS